MEAACLQFFSMNRTQQLCQRPLDLALWQKLYYKHQQSYIRRPLQAIKFLWEGHSRQEVCQSLSCTLKTLSQWIILFLEADLAGLVQPITHAKPSRLSLEQQPLDYGLDRYIWTAPLLLHVIDQLWQVQLKDSRLYEILHELGLSHPKAHRDYAEADPKEQDLAEYVIHLIRLKYLHHRPIGWKMEQVQVILEAGSRVEPNLSQEQAQRTLNHIYSLVGNL